MLRPDGLRADAPLLHHTACLRHCRLLENSPVLLRPSKQHCLYLLQGAQQLSKQLSRKDSPEGSCLLRRWCSELCCWKDTKGCCIPLAFLDKHPYHS